MSEREIYFMPLGGGQHVGASCYFLRLGNSNIILDSGLGTNKGLTFEPDFMPLLTSDLNFLLSLNQIDYIFISHAHTDHSGYLLKLMQPASNAGVYMTAATRLLTEYQLYDKKFNDFAAINREEQRLAAQYLLQRITEVNYMQSKKFNDFTVSFFQAGHIPGAMMTYFETSRKKILYTGDYSQHSTALTGGYILPQNLEVDTLILCGLHAKQPDYVRYSDDLYKNIDKILYYASKGQKVICRLSQLSKGIEFIKILNSKNYIHVPIFIDNETMKIISVMERLSEPILNIDNHSMNNFARYNSGIIITNSAYKDLNAVNFNIDFSLHEDFAEMKSFIKQLNPKQAIIVHCGGKSNNATIEDEIMKDSECRTQFIFAEDKQLYIL